MTTIHDARDQARELFNENWSNYIIGYQRLDSDRGSFYHSIAARDSKVTHRIDRPNFEYLWGKELINFSYYCCPWILKNTAFPRH